MIMSLTDSDKIIKEISYLLADCMLHTENENQVNRLDRLIDLFSMFVGGSDNE